MFPLFGSAAHTEQRHGSLSTLQPVFIAMMHFEIFLVCIPTEKQNAVGGQVPGIGLNTSVMCKKEGSIINSLKKIAEPIHPQPLAC